MGVVRAEALYGRMLVEYGDDSAAQLVGVHVAVEDASNILTKILEWGRLLSYLEQSTRYIPYNQKQRDGRWRYHVPAEIVSPALRERFVSTMDTFRAGVPWPTAAFRSRRAGQTGGSTSATTPASRTPCARPMARSSGASALRSPTNG